MIDGFLGHYNYYMSFAIMFVGLVGVAFSESRVRKLLGLSIFQSAIILFYVSTSFVKGGIPPILRDMSINRVYTAPLPHVLMLTAIVVGVATLSVGLALVVRISSEERLKSCSSPSVAE